eukprot:CAMPEP_0172633492 /NCGR_PEP_ID=MMETSP1068-20121228/189774_1 /TAXON_ID=35684 /ORGANISM="Pseudopedinella elastica, Strain CCMP716" /LENGTH=34 /DNA_ID= /DNA_START= /DNA_END= /DNA_ORIENTATION=
MALLWGEGRRGRLMDWARWNEASRANSCPTSKDT